jgi:hypothetical protein
MDTLLTLTDDIPVQPALQHALPFRVIFEEYRQRRPADLLYAAGEVFNQQPYLVDPGAGNLRTEVALRAALQRHEEAYRKLETAAEAIANGTRSQLLDPLVVDCSEADRPLKAILHKLNGHALCLSGGGIRSASFNLGLLEGLSRFRQKASPGQRETPALMERLDCISTVSGGGYIGSWLSAWILRRQLATAKPAAQAYCEVLDALAGKTPGTAGDSDPQQTRHLRRYTSYLAPELGASVDTATLVAIFLRNLLVNWTLLIPLLFAVAATTQWVAISLVGAERQLPEIHSSVVDGFLVFFFLLAALAAAFALPSHRRDSAVLALADARLEYKLERSNEGIAINVKEPVAAVWNGKSVRMVCSKTTSAPFKFVRAADGTLKKLPKDIESLSNDFGKPITSGQIMLNTWTVRAARQLSPSLRNSAVRFYNLLQEFAVYVFLACVLAGSLLLTIARSAIPANNHDWKGLQAEFKVALVGYCVLGFFIWYADWNRRSLVALKHASGEAGRKKFGRTVRRFFATGASAVFSACATCGLLYLLRLELYSLLWNDGMHTLLSHHVPSHRLFVAVAPPLVITILLITTSLFCALVGAFEQEEDREWWTRGGAVLLLAIAGWIALQGIVLYGMDLDRAFWNYVIGSAGIALGFGTSAIGFSGSTSAGPREVKSAQATAVGTFLQKHNLLLPASATLAIVLIAIGVVTLEEKLRLSLADKVHLSQFLPSSWVSFASQGNAIGRLLGVIHQAALHRFWFCALIVFGASTFIAVLANLAIDMNLFTLQGMYRMRLMRAFLGASNALRRPDPFTKFDPHDTPHMVELAASTGVPLHIINAALNLTGTKDTALRQRMAESFTFSAQTAGGWRVGYAASSEFGGGPRGLTLATAMSISGSAFNPNMGYHTSPLLSLLMTFFNLRLGVWLPNPKWASMKASKPLRHIQSEGPTFSLGTLILEAFGKANDDDAWIELTDGGHFENLGLYEMVLRRCKCIIVSDAGADPACQFEDLGNAIRKIKIDLGIPIEFETTDQPRNLKMKAGMQSGNSYCAIARIRYACVDAYPGMDANEIENLDGCLIYVKALLTGREPGDVLQYALTHGDFPNESTANQFFNEAQFESYRHLGSFIIDEITRKGKSGKEIDHGKADFAQFRTAAQQFWNSAA